MSTSAPPVTPLAAPPTDTAVDAWHATVREAHLHDLPGVPPPGRADSAGRLGIRAARTQTLHLTAPGADGGFDGVASLVLPTDDADRHTAHLDTLVVRPAARGHGTGHRLWEALRAALLADGRTSLSTLVESGGAGERFARARGFDNALPLAWYVQDLRGALAAQPQAPALPPGYTHAHWTGTVPDAHAEPFAEAHRAMADAPSGDPGTPAPAWDADRVRAAARLVEERGGRLLTAAVLHTATGEVAAYTELVLRDPADTRALQYDTVVTPLHRGRGLGRAVKRHLMGLLPGTQPSLREIATTVADGNAPMRAVNAALGYRPERPAGYFRTTL
ncbi:GNAT family N-acetyltransferase [Streptomyces sanyensis]|uniref:GNAT family N-acetyltransferase n=1 Tax=Streptomyces sanyensis TaxID=568869 RepID=UPI003D77EBB7